MPEVSVKVEIPDNYELSCDRMRPAEFRESIVEGGLVKRWTDRDTSQREYVIVRPAWVWPSWLKAAAVVQTSFCDWWACSKVPYQTETASGWANLGVTRFLDSDLMDWTPPPCNDWRDSLRINPNWKGQDDAKDGSD